MKAFISLVLVIGSVSALGSGPYLPSGWTPQGPAFYLPSEVQLRPADSPLKQTLFQETEASGSDSLREYGPPKIQDVSQEVSNQGLPDVATEQTFQVAVKTIEAVEEKSENRAATNEKSTAVEEAVVTESVVVEAKTDSVIIGTVYENIADEHTESTTTVSASENIVDEQTGSFETLFPLQNVVEEQTRSAATAPLLESIVEEQTGSTATVSTLENAVEEQTISASTVSMLENKLEEQAGLAATVSSLENIDEEQTRSATVSNLESIVEEQIGLIATEPSFEGRSLNIDIQAEVEGSTVTSVDVIETSQVFIEGVETTEKNVELSQITDILTSVEVLENNAEETVAENVSEIKNAIETSSEENLQEVQRIEELTIVEEVKTVEEGVKNIAEAIVSLENEIKADQVQTDVKLAQDQEAQISGTLEQLPEGFLEYGPPGFREYGPPNGDDLLRSADIQETIDSVGTNELRKRRFSPKFRSTKKH